MKYTLRSIVKAPMLGLTTNENKLNKSIFHFIGATSIDSISKNDSTEMK